MKYLLLLNIFCCCACACAVDPLESALYQSGNNREQLEQVIRKYSVNPADSLKLKAALYLIKNMPGHTSVTGQEEYYNEIDSIILSTPFKSRREKVLKILPRYEKRLQVVEDSKIITAVYLIDNIEQAFRVWQDAPWARHVDFNQFCEYLLPYKIAENQGLEHWRDTFQPLFNAEWQKNRHCSLFTHSAYFNCKFVNRDMVKSIKSVKNRYAHLDIPYLTPSRRMKLVSRNCTDRVEVAAAVMRSKGIPVSIDYTPQWPFRSMGHYWCTVLTNAGKNVVFEGIGSEPGLPHRADEKMPKVFRRTYAADPDLLTLNRTTEEVPATLQDVFRRDVTQEYMFTADMKVSVLPELETGDRYAYVAVFDNRKWVPVDWGEVRDHCVVFRKLGKEIAYLPVYYEDDEIWSMGYPHIIEANGQIRILEPDTQYQDTLRLYRKYTTINNAVFKMMRSIEGGMFQASNREDFRDPVTVHVCMAGTPYLEIRPDTLMNYRYWRFRAADNQYCNIAELAFYSCDSLVPVKGRVLGTAEVVDRKGVRQMREAAFDGNLLSFFQSAEKGGWVGMDFGQSVHIDRIVCIPRGDGNNIQPGDWYELFYRAKDCWLSLGRRKATDYFVEYHNAPRNALFWLRNLTRGTEERIFTWENNEQIWW